MLADAFVLAGDAAQKVRILCVGRVVIRPGAKDIVIEVQLDRVAGDAEILKTSSQKGDRRHIAHQGMVGDGLSDDPVGGDHVEYIQSLDHGAGQGRPALPRLRAAVARDMGVRGAEGDDRLKPVVLRALGDVPAFAGEFNVSLGLDLLAEREAQMAAEDRRFRMIMVGSSGCFRHSAFTFPFFMVERILGRNCRGVNQLNED